MNDPTIISEQRLKEICKIGQGAECCRYITVGVDGIQCAKHESPINKTIDARVEAGTFVAQGDNCEGLFQNNSYLKVLTNSKGS